MKLKRNFICGILLIIATIMTSVCAVTKGSFARNFNKAVGFAPMVRENDVNRLLKLMATEADLIKIGAFRKLNRLSGSATTLESKKKLILAKLQGTVELIKYYGVAYNCPKVKFTLAQGLYYVYVCKKLHGVNNSGDCLRKKIQLITSFIFSHKIEVNRFVRFFLNRTKREADKLIPDDKTIKFIDTKIACEIKFMQDKRNVLLKTAMQMYMGSSKKGKSFNCVNELLQFENDVKTVDSYPGEFHYLVAKAYGHENNYALAIDHLRQARSEEVVDSKTRETNRKVQLYYEKIYARLN